MPVGHAGIALPLVEFVQQVRPTAVLDLGVGYGLTGAILRNYFGHHPTTGAIWPVAAGSGLRIHGVESFPAYRNPMWDLYNEIVIGRIEKWLHLCGMVDLVVCNDVFEHLPKEIGTEILRRSPAAFVGVCQVMGQETVYGNPDERHITLWQESELRALCDRTFELNPGYIVGMTMGRSAVQKKALEFWAAKDEADARRLIGPVGWGRPAEEYMKELFESDPACGAYLSSFKRKKKKADILEIGCGIGRILREIAPKFGTVYGLDISDAMLDHAGRYLSGSGVQLGKIVGVKFPIESASVDLVFSTIVFQHIPEQQVIAAYLRECLRVLRPGGMVRIQTHKGTPHPSGVFGGFHGFFYSSVDAFAVEFAAAGFEVVTKQQGIGHADWIWVTARKPA